jgi:homospermidine synthase
MALLKRKTRKVLLKEVHRLIRKHGSETAVGIATGMVTEFIAQAMLDPDKDRKKKGGKKKGSKKKSGKKKK